MPQLYRTEFLIAASPSPRPARQDDAAGRENDEGGGFEDGSRGSEQEGVFLPCALAIEHTEPHNPSVVVDATCLNKPPSRSGINHILEVPHDAATVEESAVVSIGIPHSTTETPHRQRVPMELIVLLTSGRDIRTAAKQAGMGERTAHRRLTDPEFRQHVRPARTPSGAL